MTDLNVIHDNTIIIPTFVFISVRLDFGEGSCYNIISIGFLLTW